MGGAARRNAKKATDGPRVRSLPPRDLLPAAETRKRDAKSVLAQTPRRAPREADALPEARLRKFPRTLRRTAAARGREPVEDPRAEEPGESTLLPSLPYSPPRSLPPPRMFRYEVSCCDRKWPLPLSRAPFPLSSPARLPGAPGEGGGRR